RATAHATMKSATGPPSRLRKKRCSELADVRFGSKADICAAKSHVRFTPESGHVRCTRLCPLWAKGGHRDDYNLSGSNAATRGKVTLISVNSLVCVSTSIEPPCCFTMMS